MADQQRFSGVRRFNSSSQVCANLSVLMNSPVGVEEEEATEASEIEIDLREEWSVDQLSPQGVSRMPSKRLIFRYFSKHSLFSCCCLCGDLQINLSIINLRASEFQSSSKDHKSEQQHNFVFLLKTWSQI